MSKRDGEKCALCIQRVATRCITRQIQVAYCGHLTYCWSDKLLIEELARGLAVVVVQVKRRGSCKFSLFASSMRRGEKSLRNPMIVLFSDRESHLVIDESSDRKWGAPHETLI